MTHLILIRHGETAWAREHRYQGSTDVPLTEKGKRDMRAVAKTVRTLKPDVLLSSPLKRAIESARIISKVVRTQVRQHASLREINFGRWEGKTATQLIAEKDPHFKKWCQGKWPAVPGGESIASFRRRVRTFLNQCLKQHAEKKVMIVAHGGTIRMMMGQLMKWDWLQTASMQIDLSSVTILTVYSKRRGYVICTNVLSKANRYLR